MSRVLLSEGANLAEAKAWYTLQQIAGELGLYIETIRTYVRNGELVAYKFGRDYRVKREDYEAFLEKRRTHKDATETDELKT
jgi:excisionase family DNA binding protein